MAANNYNEECAERVSFQRIMPLCSCKSCLSASASQWLTVGIYNAAPHSLVCCLLLAFLDGKTTSGSALCELA